MSLRSDFEYYLEHQKELAKEYEGQYLVIYDREVVGDYEDMGDALYDALDKGYEMGDFLLEKCSADPNSIVHTFYSRVLCKGKDGGDDGQ